MIRSLEHVALSVKDMARSVRFYRDFIGMKVVFRVDFLDERIGRITGMPGAKCRITHLKLGENILELFQYLAPRGRKLPASFRQCDNGFTHIGFSVTGIHALVKKLRKKRLKLLGEPVEVRPGAWVVYFRGPDNEVCEFRQLPRG